MHLVLDNSFPGELGSSTCARDRKAWWFAAPTLVDWIGE
jgi:hypothetical protein